MLKQSEAIIYLANQRACSQVEDRYRSYHTFDIGDDKRENRNPPGVLRAFNDDTLKGGCKAEITAEEDLLVILLPLVGAVEYRCSTGVQGILEAGECHFFPVLKDAGYELLNIYEDEWINFLHLQLKIAPGKLPDIPAVCDFELDEMKNRLIPLIAKSDSEAIDIPDFAVSVGKFGGRQEGFYKTSKPGNVIFTFVIEGVFEFSNRLLHSRDGLSVWNVEEADFEALSGEAILLIMETGSF